MASTPVPSEHPKPTPAKDQPTESHELQSAGQTTTEEPTNNGIDDQSSRLPFPRLMTAYLCLSAIYFISTLDINSVAMALPAISRSLGVGSSVTWTGTAYLMGQTAFQVLYGRLSDIFGRKPVLVSCICFLIFGDLLCGFAQNATWLYICRALSGVGGGGISSLVQITVSDLVSLKDRGKYQGMLSGSIGLGASAGPFLAAGMLHRDPRDGWRWIFRIPPVLAAVCAGVMWICLPQKAVSGSWREKVRKIDWVGLLVAVAAVLFFLVSLTRELQAVSWPRISTDEGVDSGQFGRQYLAVEQLARHLDAGPRGCAIYHLWCRRKAVCRIPLGATAPIWTGVNCFHLHSECSLQRRLAGGYVLLAHLLPGCSGIQSGQKRISSSSASASPERGWSTIRPYHDKTLSVGQSATANLSSH